MMNIALFRRTNRLFATAVWRRLPAQHHEMPVMSSTNSRDDMSPCCLSAIDHFTKSCSFRAINRCHSSSANANESTNASHTNTYFKHPSTAATATIPPSSDPNEHRVKIYHLNQGIVHVQLSRPQKLNSLDMPMFESIAECASMLQKDQKVRVVILSGEGRAFCTGLDAKSVALDAGSGAFERLLERPSGYGGVEGRGNLAQDVAFLWR